MYIYIYVHIRTLPHTYKHTYIHAFICITGLSHAIAVVAFFFHTPIRPYLHTYVHTYVHTYARTYKHTQAHTHAHTCHRRSSCNGHGRSVLRHIEGLDTCICASDR